MLNHNTNDSLKSISDTIRNIMPVERIDLLGTYRLIGNYDTIFTTNRIEENNPEYFLLVVTKDTEKRDNDDLISLIENSTSKYAKVSVIVFTLKNFNACIKKGHLFAQKVESQKSTIYINEEAAFDSPGDYKLEDIYNRIKEEFTVWTGKANDFLQTAGTLVEQGKLEMGMFCLHQAAEMSFMSAIRLMTGYRSGTHNLERMIRYAIPFCGPEMNVFPRNSEIERRLLRLLQRAYIGARYKLDYEITEEEAIIIKDRVVKLYQMVMAMPANKTSILISSPMELN